MSTNKHSRFSGCRLLAAVVVCTAVLTGTALAQLPIPASTQFDVTGFLQEATVNNAADPHSGGTLRVNNHLVTVPAETIVIFPANALSWQEMFAKAPAPWGIPGNPGVTTSVATTGMAMKDCANGTIPCSAPPITTYEVQVVGNIVGGQYIAGLIYISQQGLNSGAGFITAIDYALGEMHVSGAIGGATTARVRINDPMGRYGRKTTSPDVRFTVDPDNPTIMAGSGYPMCLPRTAPGANAAGTSMTTTDALCPEENRPVLGVDAVSGLTNYAPNFTTANLTSTCGGTCVPLPAGTFPDSTKQAPFEVGDYITFSGALVKDAPAGGFAGGDGPTVGPADAATTYIAAHAITNNIAIYTFPGSNPAYIETEVFILGTGGLTVLGAGEAAIRTRFEGMMTDPSRSVHLYGIDIDPLTGVTSDRDWGTIGVDPGPAGGAGAVKGRWRFRPPCAPFGTDPATIKFDKQCISGQLGVFLPPTREMRAVIEGSQSQVTALNTGDLSKTSANGLFAGQYHAPILEYIFPENIPGSPMVENNFQAMPFLAQGGYSSSGIPDGVSIRAGQLNPWPGAVAPPPPTPVCSAVANAGGPYTVAFNGTVTLAGSGTGSGTLSFSWAVSSGSLSNAAIANPVFNATAAVSPVTATLTVSAACGASSTSTATITVNAPAAPTVNPIASQTVFTGTTVTLTATATDPQGLPVTFLWLQTGGTPVVLANATPGASVTFTPILPAGALSSTLTFQVTATNSANLSSAPQTVTVTVNPNLDIVTVTLAEYRIGKQRLVLNATSSAGVNVILTLQPYLTQNGTVYDPSVLGNTFSNVNGVLILTLVGAPAPACNAPNPGGAFATPCSELPIVVKSNVGGQSVPSALTKIRN